MSQPNQFVAIFTNSRPRVKRQGNKDDGRFAQVTIPALTGSKLLLDTFPASFIIGILVATENISMSKFLSRILCICLLAALPFGRASAQSSDKREKLSPE